MLAGASAIRNKNKVKNSASSVGRMGDHWSKAMLTPPAAAAVNARVIIIIKLLQCGNDGDGYKGDNPQQKAATLKNDTGVSQYAQSY